MAAEIRAGIAELRAAGATTDDIEAIIAARSRSLAELVDEHDNPHGA